ncbi:conserved unknown protein [Ectocarpus siliculosus]|uniref:Uncharacterized protein n=1 Tax=Ectocarpus siliculosus TaxID=2880 RepID=D7FSZ1_ECTSI|nr:conserved unknown protein [Ectocarpus siliculosus]|eukprot:CBJ31282.1 conserved unknown protein [Ectocarpus siliculosus]
MTETEGMAAVQTYVYALAATPLVSQKDKEDLLLAVDEKRSAMLSKNETSSLAAEETAKATAATATGTYKSEWYEEEPPSVYDDGLLRDLGNRFPLVAKEVDKVLLSKPESTGFSSRVLTGFREWITFTPKMMEMAEKTPFGALTTAKGVRAGTAFSAVADVLRADTVELANGGRGKGEADNVIRQMQANAAEELLSGGMGFQKRRLEVPDEDVELFVEQVLAGLVVVGETLTTPIGFRLIRCNYVKSSMEAAELSRTVKSRMAEMGLDAKVAAFLTWDVIGAFDSMENMGREIEDLESQAAMMDDDEQLAKAFNTIGAGFSLMGPQDEKMFVLIPAETKPNEDTQANEQGRTALALGAPITLFAFLGDVFNGSPYEAANGAVDGDVQLLTQIGLLGLIMAGLLLSRDIARTVAAKLVRVELEAPVLLPSFETGLLAAKRPVASFPSTSQDLFDVAIAGPTVGFATAAAALVMGLQMTAAAGPDVLAGFPSLPSSLLQCSSLVGSVVDYFLHTNLAVQDLAVERVAMHPLAVGGVAGMLWTAATVLPLPGSDGEAVIDTLDTNFKYNAIVTPLAYLFAVSQIIGGGMFLLSVLLVNFIAYPESAPLMREDNVTPVRSPARLALGVVVAAVSLAVLSPMTISSFLTGGPLSMDTGAGAESVAAGLGVGGIGFHGFL